MKTNTVRIAVIGCGRVAQHYRRILDSGVVSGWKMAGFSDVLSDRAEDFARHFDARAFTNHEEMLDQCRPDLVLVLTPSGQHYGQTRMVLERGLNVLVEKPITMLPVQARELSALARDKNVMYGVAFQNRLNPAIRCLQRAIAAQRFGRIVTATIRLRWCRQQAYYDDGWHGTWAQDGGVINQQAIHHVDALNWLLGPVESVCAAKANRLNRLEAEDTIVAAVRFESGALGTIEATTAARPEDYEASLSVVGEKGLALIGGIALNKVETWRFVEPAPEDLEAQHRFSQEVPNGYGLSHGPLLQQIIDSLRIGSTVAPTCADDAIRTTQLVHALYRSTEVGGWVALADDPQSEYLGRSQQHA
jgi:UDP-N-acetyl-2-amino-2-deoxyglucuronate dehydrogenase